MVSERLPTELFRRIVHVMIDETGIPATWRLRLVSKNFASVIPDELQKIYHMREFDIGTYRCKVGEAGLGDFLAKKITSAKDVHPDIPTAVVDTANFLISFGSNNGIEEQNLAQYSVVRHLGNVLATQSELRLTSTIETLGYGYNDTASDLQTTPKYLEVLMDRMAGAVIFNNRAAFQDCLNNGANVWNQSRTFGHVFALAASHGTHDTLKFLLQALPGKIKSHHPAFAQIHRMFFESIIAAYSAGRIRTAFFLAGVYGISIVKVPREYFDELLTAAILSKNVKAVENTLSIPVGVYYKVKWKHFEDAVLGGTPAVLGAVLPYLKEHSRFYYGCRSSVEYVVMYGRLCHLKEVLRLDNLSGSWEKDVNGALDIAKKYGKKDMAGMLREYKIKVAGGALSRAY